MENKTVPQYLKIEKYLLDEIQAGHFSLDERLPSEKELSEQFGVSRITVRKALSTLNTAGIIRRYPGKGTFLIKGPSTVGEIALEVPAQEGQKKVGVIMSHLDTPYQVSLLQSLEKEIGKKGWSMAFGLSNGRSSIEAELITRIKSDGADGMIVYPVDGTLYSKSILRLTIDNFPIVLVDRYLPGINACSVYSDNFKGGKLLGEYLTARGHRHIATFSQNPKGTICLTDRINGFTSALLSKGVFQSPDHILNDLINCSVYSNSEQYHKNTDIIEAFLKSHSEISAIFCTISTFALNAFRAVKNLKRDIEITCFDNIKAYQWTTEIPITYIAHPEDEVAKAAVMSIERLINGEQVGNTVLTCSLVEADV